MFPVFEQDDVQDLWYTPSWAGSDHNGESIRDARIQAAVSTAYVRQSGVEQGLPCPKACDCRRSGRLIADKDLSTSDGRDRNRENVPCIVSMWRESNKDANIWI